MTGLNPLKKFNSFLRTTKKRNARLKVDLCCHLAEMIKTIYKTPSSIIT